MANTVLYSEPFWLHLFNFQTLIAGALALTAGGFVLWSTRTQINSVRTDESERRRKNRVATSVLIRAEIDTFIQEAISISRHARVTIDNAEPDPITGGNRDSDFYVAAPALPNPIAFTATIHEIASLKPAIIKQIVQFYNSAGLYNRMLSECKSSYDIANLAAVHLIALSMLGTRSSLMLKRYISHLKSTTKQEVNLEISIGDLILEFRNRIIPIETTLRRHGWTLAQFESGEISIEDLLRPIS